jgi:hypothetical protein
MYRGQRAASEETDLFVGDDTDGLSQSSCDEEDLQSANCPTEEYTVGMRRAGRKSSSHQDFTRLDPTIAGEKADKARAYKESELFGLQVISRSLSLQVAEKRVRIASSDSTTPLDLAHVKATLEQAAAELGVDDLGLRADEVASALLPLLNTPVAAHSPKPYDPSTSGVTGFLIDLDGTIYKPGGLIAGARKFVSYLVEAKIPFAFVSNTGAKGSIGVQKKLKELQLQDKLIPLRHMFTAAEAQVAYLADHVPPGARVFVIAGGDDCFWLHQIRAKVPLLCDSWDIRTTLSDDEVKSWTVYSMANPGMVYVVLFVDGELGSSTDPFSGEAGYAD